MRNPQTGMKPAEDKRFSLGSVYLWYVDAERKTSNTAVHYKAKVDRRAAFLIT